MDLVWPDTPSVGSAGEIVGVQVEPVRGGGWVADGADVVLPDALVEDDGDTVGEDVYG
ncbi:hypothetical protein ABN028_24340 [Actinopolymorpha sp. B17G11]|uniref:hypothetical protein n=1 Tax=Actinopolymorpha sp. B17G11 TaxID=3160861 RepID=UPI0032E42D63